MAIAISNDWKKFPGPSHKKSNAIDSAPPIILIHFETPNSIAKIINKAIAAIPSAISQNLKAIPIAIKTINPINR